MSSTLDMSLPTAEDAATTGGTFLELPGKYHFVVIHAEANPMRGEKMVKGGFLLEAAVHATEKGKESELEKTIKLYFYAGDPTHKDGGKFAQAKQVAALIATNVIKPEQLGQQVSIDVESAKNHQFVAQLELGKPNHDGKQFLDIAFTNIYHLDDPRGKSYPRNAEIVEFVKDFRRDEAFFTPIIKAKPTPQKRVTDDDLAGL